MKKLSLMLAVLFLFSGLCFAKGNNNYTSGTTTKSWYSGTKTTSPVGGKDINATLTQKTYKDGSYKYEYTRDGQTRSYGTHK